MKKHVVFVTAAPISNRTTEENLGIGYLASVCRNNGFDATIIDGWIENLTGEQIVKRIMNIKNILFIGFSCYQLNKKSTKNVIDLLKKNKIKVPFIAGGFGPTFNPEEFFDIGIDVVSISEGEKSILMLCKYYQSIIKSLEDIPGIAYVENNVIKKTKPKLIEKLDELPFPARDTIQYAIKSKTPVNVLTSRGCSGNCTFCSVSAFWRMAEGKVWRGRSIKNIVDELEYLCSLGANYFKFVDDSFIEKPRDAEWCKEFADEIERRNLKFKFRTVLRADVISEELIKQLKRAGCDSVAVGIESFSKTALKRFNKIANPSNNLKALEIIKKYKFYVQAGLIIFDYWTTMDELIENYYSLLKYNWIITKGIFLEMYAGIGTRIGKQLVESGIADAKDTSLQNYHYDIPDLQVKKVYLALKEWHINHMEDYDMIIDPITKPKAISQKSYVDLYTIYLDIRKKDLNFMGLIISMVNKGKSLEEILDFTKKYIIDNKNWFDMQKKKAEKCYLKEGIQYKAFKNPFYTEEGK